MSVSKSIINSAGSKQIQQGVTLGYYDQAASSVSSWKSISEGIEEKYISKDEFYGQDIRVYFDRKHYFKNIKLSSIPEKDSNIIIDGKIYRVYDNPIINSDSRYPYKAIIFVEYYKSFDLNFAIDNRDKEGFEFRSLKNEKAFKSIKFHFYFKINFEKDDSLENIVSEDYVYKEKNNHISFVFDGDKMPEDKKLACFIHDKFCKYENCSFIREFFSYDIWKEYEHGEYLDYAKRLLENYSYNDIFYILSLGKI